jgi:hypothetical protein
MLPAHSCERNWCDSPAPLPVRSPCTLLHFARSEQQELMSSLLLAGDKQMNSTAFIYWGRLSQAMKGWRCVCRAHCADRQC